MEAAAILGPSTLAVTDHDGFYGILRFAEAAAALEDPTIFGVNPNVRVNDVPIDRTVGSWINNMDVMAPIAIASFDEGAIVAWSDTRNGNAINNTQDIFTSTVTFGEAEPRKVTGFQAGVVGVLVGLGLAMCLAVYLIPLLFAARCRTRPGSSS